ncbi:MAG: efflux RND transporter periplasmic adaptor subunit [Pseudomonadota bacterium]
MPPIETPPAAVCRKLASLAGAALTLLAAACGREAPPPPPPPVPEVTVVTLRAQAVPLTTELPGRTTAYRVAEVRPQVDGIILKRLFTEGAEVQAGQPLYQIDPALYEAAYASAQADAAAAAALAKRYQPLVEANAISRQDYDDAVAAKLRAEALVETARINLRYTKVLAPISGRIGRSAVTEGALVTARQDLALATIQQLDPIYVDATQPSTTLLRLQREFSGGQLKSAGEQQAEVRLRLEDGSLYEHPGKLQFAEVAVDPGTGSVTLRAVYPNPQRLLLPGMFVQQTVQQATLASALLVPQQAVTRTPRGEATALVVNDQNKVEPRVFKAERTIGDQWLVTEGLKAGERVIVEGVLKVTPGAEVKAVERAAASTAAAGAR